MTTACTTTYDFPSQGVSNVTLPGPSLQAMCSAAEYICFMTALDKAIRNNPKISRSSERIESIDEPAEEYDFIVVGGGAGGAAVTGRLAEISHWKTLLIEAGEDESAAGQIPSLFDRLLGTEIDWNYYTSNESYGCLSKNGSCYWTSARSLGGNTAHNGLNNLRGNPTDYNNWAALGNEGWRYDEVLEFFKKQEDNANIDEVGREFHGTGGPLPIGYFPYTSDMAKSVLKAAKQLGHDLNKDLNGKKHTGFTNIQGTHKNGVRVSSATAYLRPHRNDKNLDISLKSHVTKIIIENKTAVGVEYVKDGKLRSVRAKREVIVSGGVVRSPQILMLSGIGPKNHLESKGIEVVHDLPGVGENVHDHVGLELSFAINEPDTFDNNYLVAEEYLKYQTGPMSATGGAYIEGLGHTNKSTSEYPDLQFALTIEDPSCAPGKVGALRSDGKRHIAITAVNIHPKSRGRISLATNNPFDHPLIWGNYLSDPIDVEVLVDGIELALKFLEADALRAYGITLATEPVEACSDYTFLSREYWNCAVHQTTSAFLHQAGSCKMGPSWDPMAVVDPQLRVHGIKNLRVVDASIMPQVTSGNTATPTMMIGERGADFIKKTWLSEVTSHNNHRQFQW